MVCPHSCVLGILSHGCAICPEKPLLFWANMGRPKIEQVCYGDGEKSKFILFHRVCYFRLKANMNSTWQQVRVVLVFLRIGEIWTLFLIASSGQVVQLQGEGAHSVLHEELAQRHSSWGCSEWGKYWWAWGIIRAKVEKWKFILLFLNLCCSR